MGDAGQGLAGQRVAAVEREHRPALGRECARLVRPAGRATDLPTLGREAAGQNLGRVAEAEAEQGAAHGDAVSHSARTSASGSIGRMRRVEVAHALRRGKPGQRPDRHSPHHAARVAEQRLRHLRQGWLAAVADRDQHVAHEPVAADRA